MPVNRYPLLPKPVGFNQSIYPIEPVIYKIVNRVNGKVYVGQTTNFRKRLSQHYRALRFNRHSSSYLQKSFNKYGVNNFYFEILEIVSKETICSREIWWIKELNSYNKDKGYNILINTSSPWYGKRSESHCRNISIALTGKKSSLETRQKQSLIRIGRFKGENSFVARVIIQYDKNMNFLKEYVSITEAANSYGICRTSIGNCLNGRSKTAFGFIWKYKEEL